jgi:WD40 repeat protein
MRWLAILAVFLLLAFSFGNAHTAEGVTTFSPHSPEHLITYTPWDLVLALAWSPDGSLLAVSAGEWVHLYETKSFGEVRILETGVWTPALVFAPDGQTLATGSRDGSIRLWDPNSGELLRAFSSHPKGVNSLDFSPDGSLLATAGNDGMVRLLELDTGKVIAQLIGGVYAVPGVAFNRDGSILASTDGRNLRIREAATGRLARTLSGPASFFTLDYSPDGQLLAGGDSANGVRIWDAASGDLVLETAGHAGNPERVLGLVWKVAFSPDGTTLASAGGDTAVRLWEVHTGEARAVLEGHTLAATSLAFSPDGRWLASGGLDAVVRIWDLNR